VLPENVLALVQLEVNCLGFCQVNTILFDQTAGQTVIIAKRPTKGHGREIVQLGVPIIEGPPDDENQRG